jgi:hypothetical protein
MQLVLWTSSADRRRGMDGIWWWKELIMQYMDMDMEYIYVWTMDSWRKSESHKLQLS